MDSPNAKVAQQKWKANAAKEQRRLGDSTTSKLAGSGGQCDTRTRGKRVPFSTLPSRLNLHVDRSDEDDSTVTTTSLRPPWHLFCSPSSTLTIPSSLTSSSSPKQSRKPDASRVVLETQQLADLIQRNTKCPLCSGPVGLTFVSKMIASTIRIDCQDLSCGFVDIEKPTAAKPTLPAGSIRGINRNCDAAINILYVLSFLSKGDGGCEAAHVLGLLGLPNSTTIDGGSFGAIEKQVGPSGLQKIADEVVYQQNLVPHIFGQRESSAGFQRGHFSTFPTGI